MNNPRILTQRRLRREAFTLVEIMIVVAIIALLAALALPSLMRARNTARRTRLMLQLKTTADGFGMYAADNINLPLQTPANTTAISTAGVVPPGMEVYMPKNSTWTSYGDGTWYWIYWPNALPGFKGFIYLYNPTLTADDIQFIDSKLDDGNINTGALLSYGGSGILYGVE